MLIIAEMNTKKLLGCEAVEAPGPALDSIANGGLVWRMDVVNQMLLLVQLAVTVMRAVAQSTPTLASRIKR
jgi:hypothetical protein